MSLCTCQISTWVSRMGLHSVCTQEKQERDAAAMCENNWERRNTPQSPKMWLKSGQNAGRYDNFLSLSGALLATCFPLYSIWDVPTSCISALLSSCLLRWHLELDQNLKAFMQCKLQLWLKWARKNLPTLRNAVDSGETYSCQWMEVNVLKFGSFSIIHNMNNFFLQNKCFLPMTENKYFLPMTATSM